MKIKKEYIYIHIHTRANLQSKTRLHAFQADLNFIFLLTLTEIKSSRGEKLGTRDYTEALILETNPRGLKNKKRRRKERKREIV